MCEKCSYTWPGRYVSGNGWTAVDEARGNTFRVDVLYHLIVRHIPYNPCVAEFDSKMADLGFEEVDGMSPLDYTLEHPFWEDGQLVEEAIWLMVRTIADHISDEKIDQGWTFDSHWSGGCIGFWPPDEEE